MSFTHVPERSSEPKWLKKKFNLCFNPTIARVEDKAPLTWRPKSQTVPTIHEICVVKKSFSVAEFSPWHKKNTISG